MTALVEPSCAVSTAVEAVVEERWGASLRARVAHRAFRAVVRPALTQAVIRLPVTHRGIPGIETAERLAGVLRPPRHTRVRPVHLGHCKAEWVIGPETHRGQQVILYFHGGGFLTCGLRTHRRLVANISRAAGGVPVLNVEYCLLPRASLTKVVADAVGAYEWLLDRGIPADQVVVAGDSAGGYLAFATALDARDRGLPCPGAIVALSPWLEMDHAAKTAHPNAYLDPLFPIELFQLVERGAALGLFDVDLSPVDADLAGLPPTLLQVGSTEILRADAELMAQRLAAAGVPCTLQLWHRQIHDFQVAADLLPEARSAVREIGSFIRNVAASSMDERRLAGRAIAREPHGDGVWGRSQQGDGAR